MRSKALVKPAVLLVVAACLLGALVWFSVQDGALRDVTPVTYRLQYDAVGRLVESVDPAGRSIRFSYTAAPEGAWTRVRETANGPPVSETFDTLGRRRSMRDALGLTAYDFDELGRLRAVRREGTVALTYAHDTEGRVKSIQVGESFRLGYRYDFLGRLAEIQTPLGVFAIDYRRDRDGLPLTVYRYPNGVQTERRYDLEGQLQSLSHIGADSKVLARFRYEYRSDGLLSRVTEEWPGGEEHTSYQYDNVQRLASVVDSKRGTVSYHYDMVGNRTELLATGQVPVVSRFDWAGRPVEHRGLRCKHDAAGNLTEWSGEHGQVRCAYTPEGALAEVRSRQHRIRYAYDGDGRLLRRESGATTTTFVADPLAPMWRPLLGEENGRHTFFVWNEQLPLAAVTGEDAEVYLADHLGSPRLVLDAQGRLRRRMDFDPFGVPLREATGQALRPGFVGLFYDPQASLYLTQARAYEPSLGRFLQRDPIHRMPASSQQGLSDYVYCGNDPVNYLDLNGAESVQAKYLGKLKSQIEASAEKDAQTLANLYVKSNSLSDKVIYAVAGTITASFTDLEGVGKWAVLPALPSATAMEVYGGAKLLYNGSVVFDFRNSLADRQQALKDFVKDVAFKGVEKAIPKAYVEEAKASPWFGALVDTARDLAKYGSRAEDSLDLIKFAVGGKSSGGPSKPGGRPDFDDNAPKGGPASPLSPQKVGGIRLRGAGAALRELGPLRGIAVDENGRLVLLASQESAIGLPPLRLDEVVTVFRCIYDHGEAPFVSIDPDPKDTRGPIHTVRHGKGTADTYVGWVLFEADRIMKSYSAGIDTVTKRPIRSKVPGYLDKMELGFLYFNESGESSQYRNWIVPAEVLRQSSGKKELTLLDVPLKVRTERTTVRDGQIVDAPELGRTRAALEFVEWFTRQYGNIAEEAYSQPPLESGLDRPVAVFKELQRIALIAAIAESLRAQGVAMPAWMRDYRVRPCPVPKTTPAAHRTETRKVDKENRTYSIWGGVELAPPDTAVRNLTAAPPAVELAQALFSRTDPAPSLTATAVDQGGRRYLAIPLPGNDTVELGALSLSSADLRVPMGGGAQLQLVRHFHSFFEPADCLGRGWTLDLPVLETYRRVTGRTDKVTTTTKAWRLTTPLNSVTADLSRIDFVPELGAKIAVPELPGAILGLTGAGTDNRIGVETEQLCFRDGVRWHFDKAGRLAGVEEAPWLRILRHDGQGRVIRIEGWLGKQQRAHIELDYDPHGRLAKARGSDGLQAEYRYGGDGTLAQVRRPTESIGYQYQDGLVTAVLRDGMAIRRFEYAERGQLRAELQGDGSRIDYHVAPQSDGIRVSAVPSNQGASATATYDWAGRLLSRQWPDGAKVECRRDEKGTRATLTVPERKTPLMLEVAADGRREVLYAPQGQVRTDLDSAGRPEALFLGNAEYLRFDYRRDGQLKSMAGETFVLNSYYREEGVPLATVVSPKDGQPSQQLRLEYDEEGRLSKLAETNGGELQVRYDTQGRLQALVMPRGEVRLERDDRGRLKGLKTPWGAEAENTFDPASGQLRMMRTRRGGDVETFEFDHGRLTRIQQFDGGETRISHEPAGNGEQRVRSVRAANGLELTYEYDRAGRIAAVNCGAIYRIEYVYDAAGRLIERKHSPAARLAGSGGN